MSIKPVIRELRQAVLHGMAHADRKLYRMADNMSDHLDTVVKSVRDADNFDAPTPRGWLKDRKLLKLRNGRKTKPGWHFLPKADRKAARHVPEYPGEYTLDLHGSPSVVQVGDGSVMDPATFAQHVRTQTDWDGQTPIRLFSCDTGADPNGFAQQLARELKVDVTAPTKPVWSRPNGAPFVTGIDPVTGAPDWPPTGTWVNFKP